MSIYYCKYNMFIIINIIQSSKISFDVFYMIVTFQIYYISIRSITILKYWHACKQIISPHMSILYIVIIMYATLVFKNIISLSMRIYIVAVKCITKQTSVLDAITL